MVYTQREKKIAIAVMALLGAWVLYSVVVGPYLDRRAQIEKDLQFVQADIDKSDALQRKQQRLLVVWKAMNSNGLQSDAGEAQKQIAHTLEDWRTQTGLTIETMPTPQDHAQGKFRVMTLNPTYVGSQAMLAQMLWRMETASIPLRLEKIQINPRAKEGFDDLKIVMTISTLSRIPAATGSNDRAANATADSTGAGL